MHTLILFVIRSRLQGNVKSIFLKIEYQSKENLIRYLEYKENRHIGLFLFSKVFQKLQVF